MNIPHLDNQMSEDLRNISRLALTMELAAEKEGAPESANFYADIQRYCAYSLKSRAYRKRGADEKARHYEGLKDVIYLRIKHGVSW